MPLKVRAARLSMADVSSLGAGGQQAVSPAIAILLPNLMGGGAERVAVNLANEFVARGISTDLVLMRAEGEWMAHVDSRVRIVDLGVDRARHLLFPRLRYWKRGRPDTLLACMWPLTIVALIARVLSGVPSKVVFSEHTTWSMSELFWKPSTAFGIRFTMCVMYRFADAILSVSAGAARDLERLAWLPVGAVTTIYNPVVGVDRPVASFAGVADEWLDGPHKRVIAVGTLKEIKDYPTLLTAFARVCREKDARLLILGEGYQRAELEALVIKLNIVGQVSMPGFVIEPSFFWRHADLHVLSSVGEGFGNVIVEALEHGVPVVSTDCPSGPREILCDGKYGRLVPPGDSGALAAAMLQSLAEVPDREALRARARDFAVDIIAQQYLAVLMPQQNAA